MGPDYESRGGGALDEGDRGVRGLREVVQKYLDAIESELGHSWLSAAVGSLVCMWNTCVVLCVLVFCFLTALQPTAGLSNWFDTHLLAPHSVNGRVISFLFACICRRLLLTSCILTRTVLKSSSIPKPWNSNYGTKEKSKHDWR